MKKKIILSLAFIVVLGAGVWLGIYIRNKTLNPLATIPKPLESILGFLVQGGVKEDDDLLYYDTNLADFIANGSKKTKVSVEGVVNEVVREPDGDYHVVISPPATPSESLVTEFIPEIKLPLPKVGDHIQIWGIVRLDIMHNWWEIHPVVGWKKL